MIYAGLRGNGLVKNIIFDRDNIANRDDCFAPYALLKNVFLEHGVQIDTLDISRSTELLFELHQDVQITSKSNNNYLMLFETEFVKKSNFNASYWSRYRKIFTWCDELVDGDRFIKINFPNPISLNPIDGFKHRPYFCCLIAANKTLALRDSRNLYLERVKAIRWYEQNAPKEFDLYGAGWNMPTPCLGILGKLQRNLYQTVNGFINLNPFPSYRGRVQNKRDVLNNTRFAICYENVSNLPGYITEKIFDCFFSGCIPVYWGANNITKYIPENCFIDRRKFKDDESVYRYLKLITEDDFIGYQKEISRFLSSDRVTQFGSEFFAKTIVSTIVKDLGL